MDSSDKTKKFVIQDIPEVLIPKEADDYVTTSIGAFGYWQFLYIGIASLTRMVASFNTMSIVFLTPETDFVCKSFNDDAIVDVINNTCYDNCQEYGYVTAIFDETMISEFNLICKKKWLVSLTQSMLMFGILCGVSIIGWFSDRFGRSKAMILSGVTCAGFMFMTPFCPNYWSIAAARFCAGLGTGGYLALTVVYISELVGTTAIDTVICLFTLPLDGIALPIQASFAYMTSDWRTFMIVCSSMTVLVVSVTFFLPETPRWLIAKGKNTEAVDLMTQAGRFNNRDTSKISENITRMSEQLNLKVNQDLNMTYLDLFKTKKLAIWTLTSVALWFVTGFSYFGLLQYVSQFGSNLYVVVSVLGVAQIISAPISVVVVKFCGRKTSSIGLYSTIGLFSLGLIFTAKESTVAVVLGALGVIAASVSFCVVYIIVIELYPTSVRNMGLSVSSIGSKVAAIVAPFVVNMKTQWLAPLIFAGAGFIAVLFCFLLPETKGQKLKDTMDECY